jgi:hypothetical protein
MLPGYFPMKRPGQGRQIVGVDKIFFFIDFEQNQTVFKGLIIMPLPKMIKNRFYSVLPFHGLGLGLFTNFDMCVKYAILGQNDMVLEIINAI